jgi:alpha-1,6-mannosyltransferase
VQAFEFSQPSPSWPFVAKCSLAIILVCMIAIGTGIDETLSARQPVEISYLLSIAWLMFAIAYVRSSAPQRDNVRSHATVVAIIAICFTALPYGLFSDDLLRYQWDGWLSAHGISPFAFTPDNSSLQNLRVDTGAGILPDVLPYSNMRTIYPPGAQMLMMCASAVSGGQAQLFKLALWCFSVLLASITWRTSTGAHREWLLLGALSPVVLLHGFTDAHLDLLMALMMMLSITARHRDQIILSGVLLGVAISIKYLPILALPAVLHGLDRPRKTQLALSMTVALTLLYAPFVGSHLLGSLGTFTSTWQTNSAIYTAIAAGVPEPIIRPLLLGLAVACVIVVVKRWHHHAMVALAMTIMTVFLFSPVVHPWYLITPIILHPWAPLRSTIVWTASVAIYGLGLSNYKGSGVWLEHPAALAIEYLPVYAAAVIDVRRGPLTLLEKNRS